MMGEGAATVMIRHVLPNVMGPCLRAPRDERRGGAVMTEATLSFLGVGVPPTTPSLGTLIRIGSDYCSRANGGSRSSWGAFSRSLCSPSTSWATACATL